MKKLNNLVWSYNNDEAGVHYWDEISPNNTPYLLALENYNGWGAPYITNVNDNDQNGFYLGTVDTPVDTLYTLTVYIDNSGNFTIGDGHGRSSPLEKVCPLLPYKNPDLCRGIISLTAPYLKRSLAWLPVG